MLVEENINPKHFKQRLKLVKKSAIKCKNLTPEEMLNKGFELILFAKTAKFQSIKDS